MDAARARFDWKRAGRTVLIGLLGLACEAGAAEGVSSESASAEWQSVELARSEGLTARLLVKKEASAADECWMKIEYENTTGAEVRIIDPYYRMHYEALDLATGRPLRSGSLASGGGFDMFPQAWQETPARPILLPPGKYEVGEQPSNYSTALLRSPPKTGLRIRAVAFFRAKMADQTRFGTPEQGVAFEFDWLFPEAGSIEAMRQRLKAMLAHRREYYHQTYLLGALLDFPGVGDSLDIGEVLQGLRVSKGAVDGRQTIANYINARRAADPAVKEFFLQALKESDWAAADDLAYFAPDVWDDRFVEPLVRMCEHARYADNLLAALRCLGRHGDEWKDDGTTPARLSEAVIRLSPTAAERPEDLTEQNSLYWRSRARLLAMTHDHEAIPILRPFLNSPAVVQRFEWDSVRPSRVPARACDVAYNAIQAILGHRDKRIDLQDWDGPVGFWDPMGPEEAAEVEKELARRDEIIRALRASLDPQ